MHAARPLTLLSLLLVLAACGDKDPDTGSTGGDTDVDTDTDTDTDTDADTDTDTDVDTDTDTDTNLDADIAVTLRDAEGAALAGVTVSAGAWSAVTDADGMATLEAVDPDTRHVVTAWPAGLVELQEVVEVGEGETVSIRLDVPAIETAAFTPGGGAAEVTVGDLTLEMPEGLSFTTADGAAYTGDVELRFAALGSFGHHVAPSMVSDDGAGGVEAPEVIRAFELSAVGAVGGADVALVPSDGIGLSLPAWLPDDGRTAQLSSFDKDSGAWVVDSTPTYADGVLSTTITHFSWHRVDYLGSTRPMAGLVLAVNENGGPRSSDYNVSVVCTEPGGPSGGMGRYIAYSGSADSYCDEYRISSDCEIRVSNGTTVVTVTERVGGACDCSNPTRCTPITIDVGATAVCGDGTVQAGEECDDGNTAAGDGCDAACQTEAPACPCADFTVAAMTDAHAAALANPTQEIGCFVGDSQRVFGEDPGDDEGSLFAITGSGGSPEVWQAWNLGKNGSDLACATVVDGTTTDAQLGITDAQYSACLSQALIGMDLAGVDPATCAGSSR